MLSKGDFFSAQNKFRQNAKNNPCFVTLNNLGLFYISEGMELSNGDVRNATKIGLKYLKMAESFEQSHLNLMAIGQVYFNQKDYNTASDYFRRTCELSSHYINFNNLGVSLYMLRRYEEASVYFQYALDQCNELDYSDIFPSKSTIYSSYAFSILQYNKEKSLEILRQMIKLDISHIEVDEFALAYLCNDLRSAVNLCQNMFDNWRVDIPVMAMVFDCLLDLEEKDEAEKYLNYQLKQLEGYSYNTKAEINKVKKLFNQSDYRKKEISNFQYIPPLMRYCYYADCKQHNS